jgi:hypothetical protein
VRCDAGLRDAVFVDQVLDELRRRGDLRGGVQLTGLYSPLVCGLHNHLTSLGYAPSVVCTMTCEMSAPLREL